MTEAARAAAAPPVEEEGRGAGIAALVLALMSFSWGFIIVKVLPMPAAAIATWRLLIAGAFLVGAALVLRAPWPRAWRFPVLAGAMFGGHQLLYTAATQATTVAIVTLVGALQPLVVAAVSRRTVGEPVPPLLWVCSVAAVTGVAVVVQASLGQAGRSVEGDLLALANLLVFTAYFLFAKRARQEGTPTLTLTATFTVVALLVVAPVALLGGRTLAVAPVELGLLAVLALGPGNGHLLVNWAHRRVSAALASLLLAGVPILAALWAYLVLGEDFGPRHMLGMAIVVAASEGGRRVEGRRVRRARSAA